MRSLSGMARAKTTAAPSRYMTVKEVAAHLNLSERHIYDLVKEEVLTSSHFGSPGERGLRVHRESVEAFEAAAEQK